MPWKVSNPMSERMRFVLRLERGERMTDLCREFGISRKTGYKIWSRYESHGPGALADESRAPRVVPHRTPPVVQQLVVEFKQAHPSWGPRKLKVELEKRHAGVSFPAPSTMGEILQAAGLVKRRHRRRGISLYPHGLRQSEAPNDVWCADFKGEFRLGDRSYCYPLTISDHFSRFALGCEAMESTETASSRSAFEQAFREYGLPSVIRTDNGAPFASVRGIAGLSRLSAWWVKLGIVPERIEPGHPEQNGRHERFHLTLKQETTRPPGQNQLQQQERFDNFLEEYNTERPHEALEMKHPAEVYRPSANRYEGAPTELEYALHDKVLKVDASGHVHFGGRNGFTPFIGSMLAGERVGLREIEDGRWLVTFAWLDLGHIDMRQNGFVPLDSFDYSIPGKENKTDDFRPDSGNPAGCSEVSPMCPV
jgi:transposase InsO family protein